MHNSVYAHICTTHEISGRRVRVPGAQRLPGVGRGDDTVRNPHRAQISQFELFELILIWQLDEHFPVEQFEAAVSQSTVPSPLF